MELIKETLQLTETKASKKAFTSCDSDVIVPDVKPDILKILQVDASSFITSKELTDSGIKVSGKVKYTIFYLPDNSDLPAEAIHAEQAFSCVIDKPSSAESCIFDVVSDVERIDFSLLNSRKLGIKATVALSYTVFENRELTLPTGIDCDNAEVIYEIASVGCMPIFEEYSFTVRDRLELPSGRAPIDRILKLDSSVVNPEIKAITGKAVLKGNIAFSVLYLDSDGVINTISGEVPFTEVAEIFELDEDAPCHADYRISNCEFEIGIDTSGEACAVNFDISVNSVITSSQKSEIRVLSDCFCPGRKTSTLYEQIAFENAVANLTNQYTVKEIIAPAENAPEIVSVYNLFARPVISSAAVRGGKVNIDGTLEVYISYITSAPQMPIYSFKHDIPINFGMDTTAADDCSCLADISVLHTGFNLNMANELELRASLSVSAKLTKTAEIQTVSDCSIAESESESGIIIYFVQSDDTLWNIAKHYCVSISELAEINGLDEDSDLITGKRLIIPIGQ